MIALNFWKIFKKTAIYAWDKAIAVAFDTVRGLVFAKRV